MTVCASFPSSTPFFSSYDSSLRMGVCFRCDPHLKHTPMPWHTCTREENPRMMREGAQKRSLCDVMSPFDPADFYSGHVPPATSWRWRTARHSSPSFGGHESVSVWSTGDTQRHFCPGGTKNVTGVMRQ